jgi:hypothetical protein
LEALDRFAMFLSSAPELFEVFDMNIVPAKKTATEEQRIKHDCREKKVRLKPRAGA